MFIEMPNKPVGMFIKPPALTVFIAGNPAPQGSKRYVGHGIMLESSKKVQPWRNDIRAALINDRGRPKAYFDGPVYVDIEFILYRPLNTPKRHTPPAIKKSADLDKLLRAVLDAVGSAGVWHDDCQVVGAQCSKRLAEIGETTGCHLRIFSFKVKTNETGTIYKCDEG